MTSSTFSNFCLYGIFLSIRNIAFVIHKLGMLFYKFIIRIRIQRSVFQYLKYQMLPGTQRTDKKVVLLNVSASGPQLCCTDWYSIKSSNS